MNDTGPPREQPSADDEIPLKDRAFYRPHCSMEEAYHCLRFSPSVENDEAMAVHRLCLEVLTRMPWEESNRLLYEHNMHVSWLRPGDSTADFFQVELPPDPDDLPEGIVTDTSAEYFRGTWVVMLAADLPSLPDAVARGTVAHEFAHVALEHYEPSEESESQADEQARQWGFSEEIDALKSDASE